jgi:glucosylceramidase
MLLVLFSLFFLLIHSQSISVVQSVSGTSDRLTPKAPISFTSTRPSNPVTLQVNHNERYQQVLGFGGALTEAAAYVYSQLNPTLQNELIESYFGTSGNQYSVCRTHINSCDFSLASYSFDDSNNDYNLNNFSIAHNQQYLFPFIKKVLSASVNQVRLFGSPWSPPAWMKTNHEMDGSSTPGLIQDPKIFASWALYFSKTVTDFNSVGIPLWGVTIQNEPEFAAPWEACCYTAQQQRDFLKTYLGPQLRKDHPNLKIMIFDHNKDHVANWVQTITSDATAAQYVDGTAFHWYSGPDFPNLAQAHRAAPNKFLLATEACNSPPSIGNWQHGEKYGYDIIGDLNNWAVGWTDWNVLLNLQGGPNHLNNYCDAPILADTSKQSLIYQPPYYYMGQISRYITPGSYIINSTVSGGSLWAVTAETSNGKTVVVVQNQNNNAIQYTLQDGNHYATVDSPAHSIQTLVYTL